SGPWPPRRPRPRAQPDGSVHAGAQAGPDRAHDLQRLLVLGPPLVLRPVARPARGLPADPAGLGPGRTGAAPGLGGGRLLPVPRLRPAAASGRSGHSRRSGGRLHVVVDADRGQPSVRAPLEDPQPRLRRQVLAGPAGALVIPTAAPPGLG